jgi:hypothetical protein
MTLLFLDLSGGQRVHVLSAEHPDAGPLTVPHILRRTLREELCNDGASGRNVSIPSPGTRLPAHRRGGIMGEAAKDLYRLRVGH